MKRANLLIALFVIILSGFKVSIVFAQSYLGELPKPVFYQLTQQDKLNYTLSAGVPKNVKRDTFIYKLTPNNFHLKQEKQDFILVSVALTNNSSDTLRYVGMSCSWWDIYQTDNPQVNILQPNEWCYKNGPAVIKVAPYTSLVRNVPISCARGQTKTTKFRIGMVLQKYIDNKQVLDFNKFETGNVIWSNEVEIP